VAHTISNPWHFTSPGEHPSWGAFMGASGWLCAHLWEHFTFTLDTAFLLEVYPMMKGAAEFYADVLISDPGTGWLVTAPSNSPENSFIMQDGTVASVCMGPTMDIQIIRELFLQVIRTTHILGIDRDFRDSLLLKLEKLPPTRVGKHGQIMEWLEDYDEYEVHHRHISPLYGLHPAGQISRYRTPELAEAARVTLQRRGDESTGWSMAWKINFWARLGDGNHAYKLLKDLLRPVSPDYKDYDPSISGGTYINLFDTHPPFQIDGNFGGCAAIAEMLIQSHDGFIQLLPALPDAWPSGHFDGLAARGGFIVGLDWRDYTVQEVRIRATKTNSVEIMNPFDRDFVVRRNGFKEEVLLKDGMLRLEFKEGDGLNINVTK
jgi:alpha-L-fucosidase 2